MVTNPNVYNFSAKIGDEGGLHVTSGLLHFPSQKPDIYMADFKVALRKWESCMHVYKASMKSRKGGEGREQRIQPQGPCTSKIIPPARPHLWSQLVFYYCAKTP